VDIAATLADIQRLSIDERLALVEAIWDSLATEIENLPLTEAQWLELERRLADHEANPDDVVLWELAGFKPLLADGRVTFRQPLDGVVRRHRADRWPGRVVGGRRGADGGGRLEDRR